MTTAVYWPRAPTMMPASIWETSWPVKAMMPRGRTASRAPMRVKSSSCMPFTALKRISRFSVRGMKAMPRPTAAAMKSTERTLPLTKGCRMLLGTTERK